MAYDFTKMYWSFNLDALLHWPEDYETFFAVFDLPGDTLVHVGHCTVSSCKYGNSDCPITTGKVVPVFELDDDYELRVIPR